MLFHRYNKPLPRVLLVKITLYLSESAFLPEGGYVFVPDCFLPPIECEHLYGPLLACGHMTIPHDQADGRWQRIIADIDRNSFALIETADAETLFGVQIMHPKRNKFWTESAAQRAS